MTATTTEKKPTRPRPRTSAALQAVQESGDRGLTWRDIAAILGMHHGSASSVLSTLHREGAVVRLADRRDGCAVYVAPEHRGDREIIARRGYRGVDIGRVVDDARDLGYSSGFDAGLEQGRREGLGEGRDLGWQDGYDAGVAAAPTVATTPDLLDSYNDGYRTGLDEGREQFRVKMVAVVNEMLRATAGGPVQTHSGSCWRFHPACALRSVRKALDAAA